MIFSRFKNLVLASLLVLVPQLASAQSIGVLAFVKGDVKIDNASAKDGDSVKRNSSIVVAKGSCSLLIGEDTIVHLDSNSTLNVNKYMSGEGSENIDLDLEFGRVKALIGKKRAREKRFKIKTRSSVMGVRGTQIYIDSPKDLSSPATFLTAEGTATLDLGGFKDAPEKTEKHELSQNQTVDEGKKPEKIETRHVEKITNRVAPPVEPIKDIEDIKPKHRPKPTDTKPKPTTRPKPDDEKDDETPDDEKTDEERREEKKEEWETRQDDTTDYDFDQDSEHFDDLDKIDDVFDDTNILDPDKFTNFDDPVEDFDPTIDTPPEVSGVPVDVEFQL